MNSVRLGALRAGYEIRSYFRSPDQVFFTFLFPVLMLALFSTVFSDLQLGGGAGMPPITAGQYYLPAMIAAGLLLSGVQNLAVDIATERSDGTLKRLGGTPLPAASYFTGKLAQVAVTATAQVAVLLAVGVAAFGVELPTDAEHWLVFVWVFLLGLASSAVLGIALSALPRSGRSASAVVIPIVLVLQFISGVYLPFYQLPEWLQHVASVLPLKWMAEGMRYVFLPEQFGAVELGGDWNIAGVAIVLAVWAVVGLVVTRFTFRWIRRDA